MTNQSAAAVDPAPGAPALPTELVAGRYRIEGVVGMGGMGVVASAVHVHLGERVAVKLLHPEVARHPQALARCLREARASIRLRGEHVVRVFDAGTLESGAPYIVMELLTGTDLSALLRSVRNLRTRVAIDYVLQACTAIAEAHAVGIIHRDLKPANLFLTRRPDGSACIKVLDFGISKSIEVSPASDLLTETAPPSERMETTQRAAPRDAHSRKSDALTHTRAVMGSPRYMAPEQMLSARDVDVRADIWALGTILYELLSGSPAFDAKDAEALRGAVLTGAPRPLEDLGLARDLEAVILRCLQKDREQRYSDVAELARALAPFGPSESNTVATRIARILSLAAPATDGVPIQTDVVADLTLSSTQEQGANRRRRIARVLAFAAVGAIGAGITYSAIELRKTPSANSSLPAAMAPLRSVTPPITTTSMSPEAATPNAPSSRLLVTTASAKAPSPARRSPASVASPTSRPKPMPAATTSATAAETPTTTPNNDLLNVTGGELFRDRR